MTFFEGIKMITYKKITMMTATVSQILLKPKMTMVTVFLIHSIMTTTMMASQTISIMTMTTMEYPIIKKIKMVMVFLM